ncbi:MAG: FtsX-like permease family protein [Gammaproteobacteria bacterium]|nr:FtsX-like permease family protein [Gammaproteobacteria bacterium]
MRFRDTITFAGITLLSARKRTGLMLVAMAIGVGSVIVLTALGEGARRYVSNQFSSLGTHLLIVLPGRVETTGGHPPLVGGTPKDLTLNDAAALTRAGSIRRIAPLSLGSAPISYQQRERDVTVMGSTTELLAVRNLALAKGRFLPPGDPSRESAVTVIGSKLKKELFGNGAALGRWVRIHDRRFRVIGILKPLGQSLGVDVSDTAIIPVASALSLFNTHTLYRILVQANSRDAIPKARKTIIELIRKRHDGVEDITVISQNALLSTFDGIFRSLTLTVAGIAAISLAVAGILIMNVMLVSVSQRTEEIGLLKAVGSPARQIQQLFLIEAGMLAIAGATIGVITGVAGVWAMDNALPRFSLSVPLWSVGAAVAVALLTGLVFGILPARRAASLDPVQALGGK